MRFFKVLFNKLTFRRLHLEPCLFLIYLGSGLLYSVYADVWELLTRTEDNQQRTQEVYYSSDQGMHIWARANFCINLSLPSVGTYHFKFEIIDPFGQIVYSEETQKNSVPSRPQYIERRKYLLPANIFTRHGEYTLTTSFIEEYPSTSQTLRVNRAYKFQIRSGARPGQFTQVPILLQPENASIVTPYPNFIWTPVAAGAKYDFYLSKSKNPLQNILWQRKGISENSFIYPGEIALEPNQTYYWMVVVVDNEGTPISEGFGNSKVFSFSTTEIAETDEILLAFPNKLLITDPLPIFRWSSAFLRDEPIEYEMHLAEDFISNVIWVQFTDKIKSDYPVEAPALKNGRKYFWYVVGKNQKTGKFKKSKLADFTYEHIQIKNENFINLDTTSISGLVMNHRKITMPEVTVYLKRESDSENENTEYSLLTDKNGRFVLNDVPPGNYFVFAEVLAGDSYNTYESFIKIRPDINNELRIVMKNITGKLSVLVVDERGWPIQDSHVKVSNARYTWESKSDKEGRSIFQIPDGVYNIEVTKHPMYSRAFENEVYVEGLTNRTTKISTTKGGAARIKIHEAGTDSALRDIELEGKLN